MILHIVSFQVKRVSLFLEDLPILGCVCILVDRLGWGTSDLRIFLLLEDELFEVST